MDSVFLHPGELYAGRRSVRIKTILGSCIAITLWHPATRMAGMCHFVLCQRPRNMAPAGPRDCDGRYGDDAINFLLAAAQATDRNLAMFQVGVYGGASMSQLSQQHQASIGDCNTQLAKTRLRALGFRIDHWDVGGSGGRVLQLDSDTGSVQLKYHCTQPLDPGRIRGGSGA